MPLTSYEKHLFTEKWLEAAKDFDCCASKSNNFEKLNDFLKNKNNFLNVDITIPLYADINQYYKAIYG